jgi:chromosome segregation ATPase
VTEAIFLAILAALSSAVAKLWADTKDLMRKNEALADTHLKCETALAAMSSRVDHLQERCKHLEDELARLGKA